MFETSAVDKLLQDGTQLYQSVINEQFNGEKKYLMIDELPEYFDLGGISYQLLTRLENYTGLILTKESVDFSLTLSLTDALSKVFNLSTACFLTISRQTVNSTGYTSAITKNVSDNTFCCFDSHSRNREGMCTVNGKSVIVEVSSLTGLATYITELAASLFGSISETPFELVPVLITSTDSSQTIHSEKPSNLAPLTTHHDTAATPSLGMYYDY